MIAFVYVFLSSDDGPGCPPDVATPFCPRPLLDLALLLPLWGQGKKGISSLALLYNFPPPAVKLSPVVIQTNKQNEE